MNNMKEYSSYEEFNKDFENFLKDYKSQKEYKILGEADCDDEGTPSSLAAEAKQFNCRLVYQKTTYGSLEYRFVGSFDDLKKYVSRLHSDYTKDEEFMCEIFPEDGTFNYPSYVNYLEEKLYP